MYIYTYICTCAEGKNSLIVNCLVLSSAAVGIVNSNGQSPF